MTTRHLSQLVVDDDLTTGAHGDDVCIRSRRCIHEGGAAVVALRISRRLQNAIHFHNARAQWRAASRSSSCFEADNHALVDLSAATVVVGVANDDDAAAVSNRIEHIVALRTCEDLRRASEDIVRSGED